MTRKGPYKGRCINSGINGKVGKSIEKLGPSRFSTPSKSARRRQADFRIRSCLAPQQIVAADVDGSQQLRHHAELVLGSVFESETCKH